MSLRLKLSLLLLALFTFAIGNTLFTFILDKYGEEKLGWVLHTHDVLDASGKLLSSMTDAETGQRGYLLTGDPAYLESYLKGLSASEHSYNDLVKLTEDNPVQSNRLSIVKSYMDQKFKELKMTIDIFNRGTEADRKHAIDIVKKNSGKKVMDEIRLEIALFKSDEVVFLEKRKGDYRAIRAQIRTAIVIGVVLFAFVGAITIFFIREKLFFPIKLLLKNAAKMERGEKQKIEDLLPKDEMGYLLSRFYQVSEKVYSHTESLTHKATHDALTGLANRAGIDVTIKNSIVTSESRHKKMALLFIDLNKFKQLNDTLGHDAGDAVLIETGHRLKDVLRSNDQVFRLGGDEFVVILNDILESVHIKKVVKHILDKFKPSFIYNNNQIDISLSIGVSISPEDSIDSAELLKFADVAMYMAKQDTSHDFAFFDKSMLDVQNEI